MLERNITLLNLAFALVLLFSLLVGVIGPLAVALDGSSPWLLAWPLTFWMVRILDFFVFPVVALAFLYFARPTVQAGQRAFRFACLNFVLTLLLAVVVWLIDSWSVTKAKSLYAQHVRDGSVPSLQQQIVGREIPNVPLLALDGRSVDLRERIQGAKATLLVFWASYDTSWSQNMKLATAIHRGMAQQGVSVIGINEQESLAGVKSFVSAQGPAFPIFSDPDGKLFREMGLSFSGSVEQMVVVDKTGRAAAHLKTPESEEVIKHLLESTSKTAPPTGPTQQGPAPKHD